MQLSSTNPERPLAVEADGLTKRFGDKTAVDRINLQVPVGSWYGVVGPNGAGKTTTIRMIVGLLEPDDGTAEIAGVPVWPDPTAVKRLVGVLPDDLRLFERLSGEEFLLYVGLLRRFERDEVLRRSNELLTLLGLDRTAGDLVADYSTGMRKKIALAAALLHSPKVLLLDEPFESVDPVSSRIIVEVLQHYRVGGGTIVFSSHVMDTVERLCDHVAIVSEGRVARSGTVDAMTDRFKLRLEDVFVDAVGAGAVTNPNGLGWLSVP